jgi:hypothetical protein
MTDKKLVQFSDAEVGFALKKIVKAGVSMNHGPVMAGVFGKGSAKVELRSTGDVKVSGNGGSTKFNLSEADMEAIGFSKSIGTGAWSISFECNKPDVNGLMICKGSVTGSGLYVAISGCIDLEEIDRRFDAWLTNIFTNPKTPFGKTGHTMSGNLRKQQIEDLGL